MCVHAHAHTQFSLSVQAAHTGNHNVAALVSTWETAQELYNKITKVTYFLLLCFVCYQIYLLLPCLFPGSWFHQAAIHPKPIHCFSTLIITSLQLISILGVFGFLFVCLLQFENWSTLPSKPDESKQWTFSFPQPSSLLRVECFQMQFLRGLLYMFKGFSSVSRILNTLHKPIADPHRCFSSFQ